MLVVSVYGLARWYHSGGTSCRGASAYVAGAARPGDGVLFYAPYVRLPFELYFRGTRPARAGRARAVYPANRWGQDPERFIEAVSMREAPIRVAARRVPPIWLVLSQYRLYGASDPGYDRVLAALAGERIPARAKTLFCRRCSAPIRPVRTP